MYSSIVRKFFLFGVIFLGQFTIAHAASDISVPRGRIDIFTTNGLPAGYLVPVMTIEYILNNKNANEYLDIRMDWQMLGFPTRARKIGNISYQMLGFNLGLPEDGYDNPPQCVAFVKLMTDTVGTLVGSWVRGTRVTDLKSNPSGKAIAIFTIPPTAKDPQWRYDPNGIASHAALILNAEYDAKGIIMAVWVIDQNWNKGDGKIRKHKIFANGTGLSNLNNYYIIQRWKKKSKSLLNSEGIFIF